MGSSVCGFAVSYERVEDRFAYLDWGGAQVVPEEVGRPGRRWVTGGTEQPFGRESDSQIRVRDLAPIPDSCMWRGSCCSWSPKKNDIGPMRPRLGLGSPS